MSAKRQQNKSKAIRTHSLTLSALTKVVSLLKKKRSSKETTTTTKSNWFHGCHRYDPLPTVPYAIIFSIISTTKIAIHTQLDHWRNCDIGLPSMRLTSSKAKIAVEKMMRSRINRSKTMFDVNCSVGVGGGGGERHGVMR